MADNTVIDVATAFRLTLDNGRMVYVATGKQAVSQEVADHWYTQQFLTPVPAPRLGDFEFARAIRARADEAQMAADKIAAEAAAAEEAFEAAHALQPAGSGENPMETTAPGSQDRTPPLPSGAGVGATGIGVDASAAPQTGRDSGYTGLTREPAPESPADTSHTPPLAVHGTDVAEDEDDADSGDENGESAGDAAVVPKRRRGRVRPTTT